MRRLTILLRFKFGVALLTFCQLIPITFCPLNCQPITTSLCSTMAYTRTRNKCNICSYKQTRPAPIYHLHNSAKQVRVLQGVEYEQENLDYFCPTCQASHKSRLPSGLNICVSTSQLHAFHQPREQGVICPPDTFHVDWVTIPGGTIADLLHAWKVEYQREWRPMRVLLVGGLNDLLKGGNFNSVKEDIELFASHLKDQDSHHPGLTNEFSVATLLNPPKMARTYQLWVNLY